MCVFFMDDDAYLCSLCFHHLNTHCAQEDYVQREPGGT